MNQTYAHLPLVLAILDGWGIAPDWGGNAISMAKTPNMHTLWRTMPHTELKAAAEAVGLPHGIMGNSEVGHLNIGAGKIVKQFLPLIDGQIKNRDFFRNTTLVEAMHNAKKNDVTLHLVGILSDGSVHGHIGHLYALLELAHVLEVPKIAIHAFTDGRDTEPTSALSYIGKLSRFITSLRSPARIATITGRFYAMDRDNRWERTQKAYDAMCYGKGTPAENAKDAITESYKAGVIDEFIEPYVIHDRQKGVQSIHDGDVIITYNFRSDRMRQMVQALCGKSVDFNRGEHPPKVSIVTFTEYQAGLPVQVAFHPDPVQKSLAECIADAGLTQFHVAETEKYAHVTYFFNGGLESPQTLETRLLIPSPKVLTYDQEPKMAAEKITDAVLDKLKSKSVDFYVINYANADMVGHTGNIKAAIEAVEMIDQCIGRLWQQVEKQGGTLAITADHGNAEQMVNPSSGLPDTEHTKNPVPFIVATGDTELQKTVLREGGFLGNIAPTLLHIINLEKPAGMTLDSLITK